MAQTFYPITPVKVTPGTVAAWTDVDVSASVPSGATGVILHLVNTHASISYAIGLRKNVSTDNRTQDFLYSTHTWAAIGVDASRIFEAYVGSTTAINIYLVGYTVAGVTFFTNAYDKSLTTLTTWTDINAAAEAPSAIGLIWEIIGSITTAYDFGLRMNGSVDARIGTTFGHRTFGVIIGSDASQIVEGYIANAEVDFFLVGYITDGATFNLNATDISLSTVIDIGPGASDRSLAAPALYTSLDLSNPANASGIIDSIQIYAATDITGMRVGTFYLVSGTDYKCRASATIGAVAAGVLSTFTVSLAVEIGDVIGAYWATGTLDRNDTGGTSAIVSGEYIDPNDQATYTAGTRIYSLYGTGQWTDLTALPSGSVMGFIEVSSDGTYYGLRKNGSAEDIYLYASRHPWAFVEADASGIIEGKIASTAVDFFLVGYATAAGGWASIAKVNGVAAAAIAKVNGVAVASIAKVSGVAV